MFGVTNFRLTYVKLYYKENTVGDFNGDQSNKKQVNKGDQSHKEQVNKGEEKQEVLI